MPRKKTTVEPADESEATEQVSETTEDGLMDAGGAASAEHVSGEDGAFYGETPDTAGLPTDPLEIPQASAESEDYDQLLHEMSGAAPVFPEDALLPAGEAEEAPQDGYSTNDLLLLEQEKPAPHEAEAPVNGPSAEDTPPTAAEPHPVPRHDDRVLTIDAREEIQTQDDRDAVIWHEIQNAYRTRRILTGMLDGVERTDSGMTLAVVSYKGFRVAIPIREMMLYTGEIPTGAAQAEWLNQLHRILNSRLGSEIDFVVKGLDNNARSIVASRRDAMLRKRRRFYMETNELGEHMIYEGRIVQARVVAVAEKIIRVEVFGVECSIVARGLSWLWIGNARDHYNVGDRILVRVLKIDRPSIEELTVRVDARSVFAADNRENLKKCQPQCRYAGQVTDVRKGVVYIRLNNGVNAIAHACYDLRTPGKKDDVSFAVTRLDEEQGVAVGIITRIIKQNL